MNTTDWITLLASIAALITSVGGLWYQKHRIAMERKEWEEKMSTSERPLRTWSNNLPQPMKQRFEDNRVDLGLPYQAGVPVRDPKLFYGRKEQIDTILNSVLGPNMASVYIFGARKAGKTSLFYHLTHILDLDHYPQVVPVVLDAQSPISSDRNFYAYMLRETSSVLAARSKINSRSPEVPVEVDFDTLASFLKNASGKGWHFMFMLDEFENLVANKQISGEDFFSSLRSLTPKANISWIPASYRAVYMPDTNTSPFLNLIQDTCYMEPLSNEEARLLAVEPAAGAGHPFDYEDIALIQDLAGRMPFLIQKACLLLYKAHRAGEERQAARDQLSLMFRLEIQNNFESQLSMLLTDEKEALFQLASQRKVTNTRVLDLLIHYGFVEKTTSGYRILGRAFEDYLYQKATDSAKTLVS